MSATFGSRDRFAVEYELLADAERPPWLFGRMCFWAGGSMIGNYDALAALTVALATFPAQLLSHQGHRSDRALMDMPAEDAYKRMYAQVRRASDGLSCFNGVPAGFDVFDGWMAFLIEDDEDARYLWVDRRKEMREVRLLAGEFDRVIDAFLSDLEARSGQARTA